MPLTEHAVKKFKNLCLDLDSFQTWTLAAKDKFEAMEAGWDHSGIASRCKRLTKILSGLNDSVLSEWNAGLREMADKLKKMVPAKPMMHNARMLVEAPLREAYRKAVDALYTSKLIEEAADMLKVVRAVDSKQLTAVKLLTNSRRLGKLAVCVNWAVDEILNFTPKAPEDLAKHAATVKTRLKQKGFEDKGQDRPRHILCSNKVYHADLSI